MYIVQAGCETRLVLVDGSPAYLSTHTTRGKSKRSARSASTDEADALAFFAQQFKEVDPVKVQFSTHCVPLALSFYYNSLQYLTPTTGTSIIRGVSLL